MTIRRRAVPLIMLAIGSGCTDDSNPGAGSIVADPPTSTPVTSSADPLTSCADDRPAEVVSCVLIRPSRLGPEWSDMAGFEQIEQPDVVGVEEVAMCGSTVVLTPEEKRGIRLANIDPADLLRTGALTDVLNNPALQNATTLSASVSYYSDEADAALVIEDVRRIADSCGGEWTDAGDVAHEIEIEDDGPTSIEVSISANPLETMLSQDSAFGLCDDPDVANAIDLAISAMEPQTVTAEQLREFICSGMLDDFLESLTPLGEISIVLRVTAIEHMVISTVVATARPDSVVLDRAHNDMVTRAGG